MSRRTLVSTLAASLVAAIPAPGQRVPLGGPATVADCSPNAFGFPLPMLDAAQRRAFSVGNSFFRQNWIEAPASASARDGLGPLFNAASCSACHLKDGRGAPPTAFEGATGLLIRLGVPAAGGPDQPHPVYGGQLQDRGVRGLSGEARVVIEEEFVSGRYGDGTPFELVRPVYRFDAWADGAPGDDLAIGPRIGQQLIGVGLLEAIPTATLLGRTDPDDEDGDGISGRVHVLPDGRIGRFGWKAEQPTIRDQVAAAFAGDLGITSPRFPNDDVTAGQWERLGPEPGEQPEIDDHKLDRIAFYCATLAVPAQRDPENAAVHRGEALFHGMGCVACHVPTQKTGAAAVVDGIAEVTFRPYTDLLLHDLGPELADGTRPGDAGTSEWRTPPLWGIGLFETVNGHTRYLHDGRARDLSEAVLWHGGEAQAAREAFRCAPPADRADLLAFLQSL
ncbi:MAG: hypothetical protein RL562_192 [Planctomycetota bacterium]